MAFGNAKANVKSVQRRALDTARAKEQREATAGKTFVSILASLVIVTVGVGAWAAWRTLPTQEWAAGLGQKIASKTAMVSTKRAAYKPRSRKRERPQDRRNRFWKKRCNGGNGSVMCQIRKEISGGSSRRRSKPDLSKGLW